MKMIDVAHQNLPRTRWDESMRKIKARRFPDKNERGTNDQESARPKKEETKGQRVRRHCQGYRGTTTKPKAAAVEAASMIPQHWLRRPCRNTRRNSRGQQTTTTTATNNSNNNAGNTVGAVLVLVRAPAHTQATRLAALAQRNPTGRRSLQGPAILSYRFNNPAAPTYKMKLHEERVPSTPRRVNP
jgi:hypothetical protein